MIINIPNFFKSKTPESLREQMLEYISVSGLDVKFFDIQYDGKNWVCWFYQTLDTERLLSKRINEE
jgi:hypothetical protein